MKETGIIRKIDDLGRIVIPKEIRKVLRIREGDPVEIYVEKTGEIILKRFAPLGEAESLAKNLANVLSKSTGYSVYITDTTKIIAASQKEDKGKIDKSLSEEYLSILDKRMIYQNKGENQVNITEKDSKNEYLSQIIAPINSLGDIVGGIVLFSKSSRKTIKDDELKALEMGVELLTKELE